MLPMRFYEFPDIQRTIDIMIGVFLSAGIGYIWKKREILVKNTNHIFKFTYVIFSWIQSDFFSFSSVLWMKMGYPNVATFCKKQAFKTIGTFPLLAMAHSMGHKDRDVKDLQPIEQCNFCKFFAFN